MSAPPPTPDIVVSRDAAGHIDGLLCPDCRMDTIWPSWCTCTPQRIHTTAGMGKQSTRGSEAAVSGEHLAASSGLTPVRAEEGKLCGRTTGTY